VDDWKGGKFDGWMGCVWMDEWLDGGKNRQIDIKTNRWMDGRMVL